MQDMMNYLKLHSAEIADLINRIITESKLKPSNNPEERIYEIEFDNGIVFQTRYDFSGNMQISVNEYSIFEKGRSIAFSCDLMLVVTILHKLLSSKES